MIDIKPLSALSDNYVWILGREGDDRVVIVDPGEAAPVQRFLAEQGKRVGAYLIDYLIMLVCMIPYYIGSGLTASAASTGDSSAAGTVLMLVGGLLGNACAYAMYRLRYESPLRGCEPHTALAESGKAKRSPTSDAARGDELGSATETTPFPI